MKFHHKTIKTQRLKLRRPYLCDVSDIFICTSDESVCRYEAWEQHKSELETLSFINELICSYDDKECYDWIIEEKDTKRAIGIINLHDIDFKNDYAYIGYWLARDRWNLGYAKEALASVIQICFKEYKIQYLKAFCHPKNEASKKVLEKCGFIIKDNKATKVFDNRKDDSYTDYLLLYELSFTEYISNLSQ